MNISGRDIVTDGRIIRIARIDGDKYRFLGDPEVVLNGLRKSRIRPDIFTFMQKLPETEPKYQYPMVFDNFAALSISTFDEWWTKQLGFKGRNKAKQAEKRGVVLREMPFNDTLIRGIWEIYNECPVRQGKPFGHYGKDLETVRRMSETFLDCSIFIGAFHEEKLIGFVKLTMDETRVQAGLMHIISMVQHRDKAPTNALIAHAVRSCAERKIPYLVYSNFAYGKKERDSLSDFKERNGFKRIDVPRYYVPLTPVGWLAYRLGLHRKLSDRVPEPLLAKLREFRNSWYSRKYRSSAETS
jgi:hypothetical protein